MVTDEQVRRLRKLIGKERTYATAAAKAGMDEKTARKWRRCDRLPSECLSVRTYRTRPDAFEGVWEEVRQMLAVNPGLQAKTIFDYLQRQRPGRFADGQLRTLQRKVRVWRATEGPPKEVFFPQVHRPGKLAESDFTHLSSLNVTIQGKPFDHLLYHFVLTYSNWETGTICYSESFEALSEGLENALWELRGVPDAHRTDQLSTAVVNLGSRRTFTRRYQALMDYYGMSAKRTRAGEPHENGDVEQRHHRFKLALDQALMLRGSRDFASVQDYQAFLRDLFCQLNAGRKERLLEELAVLRPLPRRRLGSMVRLRARVGLGSTINVRKNIYSVNSRLIGETVDVHLYVDHLKVFFAQRLVDTLPRLRGAGKHRIDYRHVIDWLMRKPAAFENYRYRADLFPSITYRLAYDRLGDDKQYLDILGLAATEGQRKVEDVLRGLLDKQERPMPARVRALLDAGGIEPPTDVRIAAIDLLGYDSLLTRSVIY